MPFIYSRPYNHYFWQIFQAILLFPAPRLFRTFEYQMWTKPYRCTFLYRFLISEFMMRILMQLCREYIYLYTLQDLQNCINEFKWTGIKLLNTYVMFRSSHLSFLVFWPLLVTKLQKYYILNLCLHFARQEKQWNENHATKWSIPWKNWNHKLMWLACQ